MATTIGTACLSRIVRRAYEGGKLIGRLLRGQGYRERESVLRRKYGPVSWVNPSATSSGGPLVTSGLGTSGTLSETAHSTPGFGVPAQVNAALLHGNASLSAELEVLRDLALRDGEDFKSGAIYDEEAGEGARVGVAEWFTHRKRGLLVPFGIGLRYVIW